MNTYLRNIVGEKRSRESTFGFANLNDFPSTPANNNGKTRKRRALSSVFKSAANATKKAVRKLKPASRRGTVSPVVTTASVFSIETIIKGLLDDDRENFVKSGFLESAAVQTTNDYEQIRNRIHQLFDKTADSPHCSEKTRHVLQTYKPVLATLVAIDLLNLGELPDFHDLLVSAGAKCTVMQINDGSVKLGGEGPDLNKWDSIYFGYLNQEVPTDLMMTDFGIEYSVLTQFSLLYANGYIQLNKEWFAMNDMQRPMNIPREDIYKRIRSGCGLGDLSKEDVLKEVRGQYYPTMPVTMSLANFMKNGKNGGVRRRTRRYRRSNYRK